MNKAEHGLRWSREAAVGRSGLLPPDTEIILGAQSGTDEGLRQTDLEELRQTSRESRAAFIGGFLQEAAQVLKIGEDNCLCVCGGG